MTSWKRPWLAKDRSGGCDNDQVLLCFAGGDVLQWIIQRLWISNLGEGPTCMGSYGRLLWPLCRRGNEMEALPISKKPSS